MRKEETCKRDAVKRTFSINWPQYGNCISSLDTLPPNNIQLYEEAEKVVLLQQGISAMKSECANLLNLKTMNCTAFNCNKNTHTWPNP